MKKTHNYKTIEVSINSDKILSVRLNRVEVRNAFNSQLIEELGIVFEQEVSKKDVRVVVLSGAGPVFCAGGDLNWMKNSANLSHEENIEDAYKLALLFSKLNECPKPVVGSIQGAAIGGGVGLVSICDVAIATSDTQFSLSEVRLGIIPACIGPFVIAKIGPSHARALFISGGRFQAQKAKEIGLIHETVADEKELKSKVEKIVENILQCGPNAVRAAKNLILQLSWPERRSTTPNYLNWVSEVLADLRTSPEGQEGVKAFLEKRQPNW